MSVHLLHRKQHIPAPLSSVWKYFSSPANLREITPAHFNFRVTSGPLPERAYPGQIITYKVSPLLGIPLFWMTEITHVEEGKRFVDEQRRGPYSLWHHQHHFEEVADGVLMTDIVHYALPLGLLGDLAHSLFVKAQLRNVFDYRSAQVLKTFGGSKIEK